MNRSIGETKIEVNHKVMEIIHAWGHENILATNRTTFEITKDRHLTKRGDCIVAVNSDKAAVDLSQEFKRTIRNANARLTIAIRANRATEIVHASGNALLPFTHATDLVVRKSDFISDRTLAIKADKAAKDFPLSFVKKLQNPKQKVMITLTVETLT